MADNKKVVILGGGTVYHIRNHLAVCAPAYGTTAKQLAALCKEQSDKLDIHLILTKMAGGPLETNDDIQSFVDDLVRDLSTKIVFFNVAMCDWTGYVESGDEYDMTDSGKYETRLKTSDYRDMPCPPRVVLEAAPKVIGNIRKNRKDIFLVGFKTTCGETEQNQYLAGLNLLKATSCNLVLANDTKTRRNMVITPEEAAYHVTTDRTEALKDLVEMAYLRSHLTFTRSTIVAGESVPWDSALVPDSLRRIVNHCVDRGAYKPFRGATVGHFAVKLDTTSFLTSKRKTNFNDLKKVGLVRIETDGPDTVLAYGSKPSVGGQSQRIVFAEHADADCIVHFHCPMKTQPVDRIQTVSQREYECGSHQCGQNTSSGLKKFTNGTDSWYAVHLDQHGPNIVFNKNTNPETIIKFIEDNFDLSGKTGGYNVI